MKEYESKSLEELRYEDYQANRKGPSTFGTATGTNLFSSAQSTATTPFNAGTTNSIFGTSKPTFGTGTTNTSTTSIFNASFNKPANFQSPFGANPTFGTATAQTAQQPVQATSLFSNTGSTAFTSQANFFQNTTQTNAAKPFFNINTTTTQQPFLNSSFTSTSQAKPISFGATNTTFGANLTTSNQGTFNFNPTTTSTGTNLFSNSSSIFNNNASANAGVKAPMFNFPSQPLGTSTSLNTGLGTTFGTGTNLFGTGTTNLFGTQNTTGSLFSNPIQTNQTQVPTMSLQQSVQAQSPTSELLLGRLQVIPYGDSPLFQNNLNSSTTPSLKFSTDPKTLYQYRVSAKSSSNHKVKRSTSTNQMNTSLLFDGLEEENLDDKKTAFDLFVPRRNIKRLVLKPKDSSLNTHDLDSPANASLVEKSLSPEAKENIASTMNEYFNHKLFRATEDSQQSIAKTSSSSFEKEDEDSFLLSPSSSSSAPLKCGVILTKAEYYTIPSLDQLDNYYDSESNTCIVPNFTVGREGYGSVYWKGPVDIQGLNLNEIVHFRRKEIIVYPDDDTKPVCGEELNRPAQVTLHQVWPVDKTTHTIIKDINRLKTMKYAEKIEMATIKLEASFKEYRSDTGTWVFQVKHFSKYGLLDEENEDDEKTESIEKVSPIKEPSPKVLQPPFGFMASESMNPEMIGERMHLGQNRYYNLTSQAREQSLLGNLSQKDYSLQSDSMLENKVEMEEMPLESIFSTYYDSMRIALFNEDEEVDNKLKSSAFKKSRKGTMLQEDKKHKPLLAAPVNYVSKAVFVRKRELVFEPDSYPLMNQTLCDINSITSTTSPKIRFFNGSSNFTFIKGSSVIIYDLNFIPNVANHFSRFDVQFKENSNHICNPKSLPFLQTKSRVHNRHNVAHLEKLIEAFFGPLLETTPYGREQERINRVINWLSERNRLIKMPRNSNSRIFYFLCCNDVKSAVNEAIQSRQPKLAFLLCSGNNFSTKDCLIKQLDSWRKSGADEFINHQLLKIYVLLSGGIKWIISTGQEIDVLEGLTWTQQLGLMLLFTTNEGFEDCINNLTAKTDDVEHHILAQHSSFQAMSSALNILEAWFLHSSLQSYSMIKDESKSDFLHVSLCGQLISKSVILACIVGCHIRNDDLRELVITEAISLFISKLSKEDLDYLGKLDISKEMIAKLKSIYFRSTFDYLNQANSLLDAHEWSVAHEILIDKVFPELVINEDHESLGHFIERLKPYQNVISNWWSSGGHIYDFYLQCMTNTTDAFSDLDSFNVHQLKCSNNRQILCQSEMARKVNLMLVNYENGYFSLNTPIPNDYVIQELNHNCKKLLQECSQ